MLSFTRNIAFDIVYNSINYLSVINLSIFFNNFLDCLVNRNINIKVYSFRLTNEFLIKKQLKGSFFLSQLIQLLTMTIYPVLFLFDT